MSEAHDIDEFVDPEIDGPIDGRVARRQRNIDQALEAAIEMFAEDAMFPTIEQIATRSGLSVRSLYRYFTDPGELREAAISRAQRIAYDISLLHRIGEGPLDDRISDFVDMRLRLYETMGSVFRAAVANSPTYPRVSERRMRDRDKMLEQFELQFATELATRSDADRTSVVAAGDLITQLESLEFLRGHRGLSADECRHVLTTTLHTLLT